MSNSDEIKEKVIDILSANKDGLSQNNLESAANLRAEDLIDVTQNLIRSRIIETVNKSSKGKQSLIWRIIPDNVRSKEKNLNPIEREVNQMIRMYGSSGVVSADILMKKAKSNMTEKILNKIIEKLREFDLVKIMVWRKKKIYVAYDVEPDSHLTEMAPSSKDKKQQVDKTLETESEIMKYLEQRFKMAQNMNKSRRDQHNAAFVKLSDIIAMLDRGKLPYGSKSNVESILKMLECSREILTSNKIAIKEQPSLDSQSGLAYRYNDLMERLEQVPLMASVPVTYFPESQFEMTDFEKYTEKMHYLEKFL